MLKKYDYNFILYFLYSLILFVIPWKLFLDDNFAYIFSIIARLFFCLKIKLKQINIFILYLFLFAVFLICFYFFLQKTALKLKI